MTTTTTTETVLDARGVTMRFGGLTAVKNVDLTVRSGEIVGLIGPNGAGKTTFFNCLTGLYIPTEGEVRYKGTVLPPKSYKVTAAGIARTFQNIRLFNNMTVLENVLVGRHTRTKEGLWSALLRLPSFGRAEEASRQRAMELLEFIGLDHKADHLARNLPYGEQRKLEIARALASDPGLILLDEPTAGMNPQETRAAEELIFAIRDKGIAVLVIEHDMRFIFNLCDRVACLVQGQKLIEGTATEVQSDERVIAAYLGEPFEGAPGAEEAAEVAAAEAGAAVAVAPEAAEPVVEAAEPEAESVAVAEAAEPEAESVAVAEAAEPEAEAEVAEPVADAAEPEAAEAQAAEADATAAEATETAEADATEAATPAPATEAAQHNRTTSTDGEAK
ncbi:ABC transporter ATP-binding protein [Streptomyces sp. M-16]|uniref:ABC transporter ATP-binding protein n=1 Tax=Streptomyces sp. M-16 TaxID=3233040 RepID=UPI003F965B40